MRIMEIQNDQEIFSLFSLAMVSYGYVGDLLQNSENLRYNSNHEIYLAYNTIFIVLKLIVT